MTDIALFDLSPRHVVAELPELPDGSALELHLRTPEEARGGPVAWWVTADGRWAWRVVPASA